MDMQFTPHREHQDFAGVAYIKNHDNDTACTFTASQTGGATSLKLAVDYTECGGAALAKSVRLNLLLLEFETAESWVFQDYSAFQTFRQSTYS